MEIEVKLKEIGERLKEIRQSKGYKSYEHFAWDNELNRQTVFRAERGEAINLQTFIRILNALDIQSLEEFFKGL